MGGGHSLSECVCVGWGGGGGGGGASSLFNLALMSTWGRWPLRSEWCEGVFF